MHAYLMVGARPESKGIRMPEALSGLETESTICGSSGCASDHPARGILIAGFPILDRPPLHTLPTSLVTDGNCTVSSHQNWNSMVGTLSASPAVNVGLD